MIALKDKNIPTEFEKLYFTLREKEGRIYSDEELLHLPDIAKGHIYSDEWEIRKESCYRLLHYLENKRTALKIWEPCCGNGWLSARLAGLPGSKVIATDIITVELEQAKKVFNHIQNLTFEYGNISDDKNNDGTKDVIILASCIQYFQDPETIINSLFEKLSRGGEIHILDSPFYKPDEINIARQRSVNHFYSMGVPEMKKYYFHHALDVLISFQYTILYQPSFFQRLKNYRSPFPWIRIKKSK